MSDQKALRRAVKLLVIGYLVLLVNSSYLAGYADPTLFYFGNVALHLILGVVLTVAFATYAFRRFRQFSRTMKLAVVLLAVGAALGLFMMKFGATRQYRWALYSHIAFAVAGSIPLLLVLARGARNYPASRRRSLVYVAIVSLIFVFPIASTAYNRYASEARNRIVNPDNVPLSMGGEGSGPNSPFFPSSAETNVGGTIPSTFFMTSKECARCHKEIYDQFNGSAHHFGSFNNQWYRKSIEYMQDVVGTQPSKWCAGCHDHAVFFNGRFDRPIKEQINTPEAQAGLSCTSCHSIVHVGSTMGQGDFTVEYPALHDLAASENPLLRKAHDTLIYLAPAPHRNTFIKPFHREQTAEFCSSCHKVHLDVPVNAYRWFRGFNDYDNWQASGFGEGARSFYYPPKGQKCVDCHMPLVASHDPGNHSGEVHSHRFPGANMAVSYANRDHAQMGAAERLLKSGFISVDIFAVSPVDEQSKQTAMVRRSGEGPQLMTGSAVGEEAEQV